MCTQSGSCTTSSTSTKYTRNGTRNGSVPEHGWTTTCRWMPRLMGRMHYPVHVAIMDPRRVGPHGGHILTPFEVIKWHEMDHFTCRNVIFRARNARFMHISRVKGTEVVQKGTFLVPFSGQVPLESTLLGCMYAYSRSSAPEGVLELDHF